jgi:cell division protein FtsQ
MPRVAAPPTIEISAASRIDVPPQRPRTSRARKPAPPQDRLTQRKLFFRRVKRSLKPGLWFLVIASVGIVGYELVRSLPSAAPAPQAAQDAAPVATPSASPLADFTADLGLRISNVQINGATTTDPALLQQAIGVKPGDPTLGFSLQEIRDRVEQLGPVQSAVVARELPGTLVVNVTERNIFAIWQTTSNGQPKFVLIDKQGNVIANQDAAEAKRREPSLLLLSGEDAPANANTLVTELQAAPAVLSHVAAAQRVDGLRWNLILKNQTVVKLPSENEADAIGQLAALENSMQLLERPVEVIDLRQEGRLVVKPYPAPTPPAATKQGATQKHG